MPALPNSQGYLRLSVLNRLLPSDSQRSALITYDGSRQTSFQSHVSRRTHRRNCLQGMAAQSLSNIESYLTCSSWAAVGVFFGLALTLATARTAIRVYKFRQVFADDGFLFLSIITLVASTGLFYSTVPSQYHFAAAAAGLEPLPPDFLVVVAKTANIAYAAETLAWTTIFAVKFSFLFYFRGLIRRLQGLNVLWWCTLVV